LKSIGTAWEDAKQAAVDREDWRGRVAHGVFVLFDKGRSGISSTIQPSHPINYLFIAPRQFSYTKISRKSTHNFSSGPANRLQQTDNKKAQLT